jgi:hypothetical protein
MMGADMLGLVRIAWPFFYRIGTVGFGPGFTIAWALSFKD